MYCRCLLSLAPCPKLLYPGLFLFAHSLLLAIFGVLGPVFGWYQIACYMHLAYVGGSSSTQLCLCSKYCVRGIVIVWASFVNALFTDLGLLSLLMIADWPSAPPASSSPFSFYRQLWSAVVSGICRHSFLLFKNKRYDYL